MTNEEPYDSFAAGLERKEAEEERDERIERESREEALAEWKAMKAKPYVYNDDPDDECPHDEHDHGICLECGKDIMDDLIDRAELMRDAMEDR